MRPHLNFTLRIFCWCVIGGQFWLFSSQPLLGYDAIDSSRPRIAVVRSFLKDDTGHLTLDQVSSPELVGRFAESGSAIPSFGYTRAVIWGRFVLTSDVACTAIIELSSTRIDDVSFFELHGRAINQAVKYNFIETDGSAPLEYPGLKMLLTPGRPVTVLCRLQSEGSLTLPWLICSEAEYRAVDMKRRFVSYTQIGASAAVIMLALLLTLLFRDLSFAMLGLASLSALISGLFFDHVISLPGLSVPSVLTREWCAASTVCAGLFMLGFAGAYVGYSSLSTRDRWILLIVALFASAWLPSQFFMPPAIRRLWLNVVIVGVVFTELWIASSSWRQTRQRSELVVFVVLVLCHAAQLMLMLQLSRLLPSYQSPSSLRLTPLPVIFTSVFALLLRRRQVIEQLRLKTALAEAGESQSRLLALRYQLNPHLLFNSLTTVSWLSGESPEKIPQFIDNLAAILQSLLRPSPQQISTVADELRLARCMLELATMRFGERIRFTIRSSADADAWQLPELILQPLVENAIKFTPGEGGEIEVVADVRQGRLILKVANCVSQEPSPKISEGLRIGHENIRQRLDLFYGGKAEFRIHSSNGVVTAELELISMPHTGGGRR